MEYLRAELTVRAAALHQVEAKVIEVLRIEPLDLFQRRHQLVAVMMAEPGELLQARVVGAILGPQLFLHQVLWGQSGKKSDPHIAVWSWASLDCT